MSEPVNRIRHILPLRPVNNPRDERDDFAITSETHDFCAQGIERPDGTWEVTYRFYPKDETSDRQPLL